MQAGVLLAQQQRGQRPFPPTRVNRRSKFGPDLLFAALYNEQSGVPYDLVAPYAGPGTLNGTASYRTALGAIEQGVGVDGTTNHLTFGNPVKLQFTQLSSFTIVSCFYLSTAGQAFPNILSKYTGLGTGALWMFRLNVSDQLSFFVGNFGALGSVSGATTIVPNVRTVAAARRDVSADTLAVFLNGKLDGSATDASTGTWTMTTGEVATELVANNTDGLEALKVFDFIFNRALTNAEIAEVSSDPYSMFEWDLPVTDMLFPPIILTRDGHIPVEWLATLNRDGQIRAIVNALQRNGNIPVEFGGQPANQLLLIWKILRGLNVPLLLQWNIVREALSQGLTLQFNVRQTMPSLQLRWRVLPPIEKQFVDNDVHNPTASVVKTP